MIALLSAALLVADPNPEAVRLTRQATAEYNAGQFGQAFLDYQAAYDLEPAFPELLYDMAQCQRELHHWERADFLYKRYLTLKPQAHNRAKVETYLAQVEAKVAARTQAASGSPAETENVAPHPPDEPATSEAFDLIPPAKRASGEETETAAAPSHLSPAVWIVGGVGAACLLGGGGLGLAVLLQPDAQSIAANGQTVHSLTYAQLSAINAEGTAGLGLAIGGAVLLGTAAVLAVVLP